MKRREHYWKVADVERIYALKASGKSIPEIAEMTQRSQRSIRNRLIVKAALELTEAKKFECPKCKVNMRVDGQYRYCLRCGREG